jgi:hypothetical protein
VGASRFLFYFFPGKYTEGEVGTLMISLIRKKEKEKY